MRATDLLTCLAIDFSDNHFDTLLIQENDTYYFISGMTLKDQCLFFETTLKNEECLSIKEFTTELMLHKEAPLYKMIPTPSIIYGYRTKANQIIF